MSHILKQLAAWKPSETHKKFAEIAKMHNRSISGELGMLVDKHIEENKKLLVKS